MPPEHEVLDPDNATDITNDNLPVRYRHPSVPVSLNELAARKGEAIEILEARILILETARARAIRMTAPEDWVLFKSPDDRVTGYLQDAGCDRIRDVTGIEVFGVTEPQREASADGQSFMYLIRGNGRSRLTLQVVEDMEGGRMSTDDFCRDKKGVALELAVRKAARANLDGNIVRELAGLKSVPLEDLQKAWEGTGKNWDHCRKGRGFGTKEERSGGERADAPKLAPPHCDVCGKVGVFRTSARGGFYGCSDWRAHQDRKWSVDLKDWEKDPRSKAAQAPTPETSTQAPAQESKQPQNGKPAAQPRLDDQIPPLTDDDIFGGGNRGRR